MALLSKSRDQISKAWGSDNVQDVSTKITPKKIVDGGMRICTLLLLLKVLKDGVLKILSIINPMVVKNRRAGVNVGENQQNLLYHHGGKR